MTENQHQDPAEPKQVDTASETESQPDPAPLHPDSVESAAVVVEPNADIQVPADEGQSEQG